MLSADNLPVRETEYLRGLEKLAVMEAEVVRSKRRCGVNANESLLLQSVS